jgi:hypothetical protein
VFEGLPEPDRFDWHAQIADAIATQGRDWQTILHAVHAGMLRSSYRSAGSAEAAVRAVLDLHKRAVRGEAVPAKAWSAAQSARSAAPSARSAARSAAWSAARSAAWSAAWSAAESAARSAQSAAESAARSAQSAAYRKIRDVVLTEIARAV